MLSVERHRHHHHHQQQQQQRADSRSLASGTAIDCTDDIVIRAAVRLKFLIAINLAIKK